MTAVAETTQPRHLILTVYGLYSRTAGDDGGWLSVAALVALLGDLGVDEPAVRSSISRLKRRGTLRAGRRGGVAGYELSEQALAVLREGDRRIFRRERADLADGWLLAVFSVPESERDRRHVLRTQLTRLGFGTIAPGVWIAPGHLADTTAQTLRHLGLSSYAELFHGEHIAFADLSQQVRRWWDLDELDRLYREFLATHAAVLRRRATPGSRAAFVDYVRVLTDWRRLPYRDPGLPAAVLPRGWSGVRAADRFFALKARLEGPARTHVTGVISA